METPTTDLRDVLLYIRETYDRNAKPKTGVPAQDFLRGIRNMSLPLPAGLHAKGNGGKGGPAACPWVGVFDPDISAEAREGLYLAYIFATDMSSVSLTLQQGVEDLKGRGGYKTQAGRDLLRGKARRLQSAMLQDALAGWKQPLDLKAGSADKRPLAYEAGSIAARRYDLPAPPSEMALREDLWDAARILQLAARVEQKVRYSDGPEQLLVEYQPDDSHSHASQDTLDYFRPKNDADYVAHITARTLRKTRRHETLVAEFGEYVKLRGFIRNTKVHPKDLVLRRGDDEWLVEAKVVRVGNVMDAGREAVGQLFEYRHFFSDRKNPPHLLALFTEDIQAYADYLETLGIGSVWKTAEGWVGSRSAVDWGLVHG
ncbi:DUF3578 domain-containing protein [Streptomyces sp. MP131-18]|uniref:MrcB family domain-containing protein n=1 Tax=Streptomyces sp. MP131-18 TaxID=1857892 RepID=UPI00097C5B86|nr:DUF3578 domain-containing protein [Streptomyces sp. MP131-18]ONK13341.1 hypothetical protein STBA_41080 [Streptomyces sp. MP131-18]